MHVWKDVQQSAEAFQCCYGQDAGVAGTCASMLFVGADLESGYSSALRQTAFIPTICIGEMVKEVDVDTRRGEQNILCEREEASARKREALEGPLLLFRNCVDL